VRQVLDNRTLHAGLVGTRSPVPMSTRAGGCCFPHPGRITAPTYHGKRFTWQQRRDAGSFRRRVVGTLEHSLIWMLDAHEKAIPRRLRGRGQI